MREVNPDYAIWSGSLKTNALLADIFDILAIINSNINAMASGKAAKRPKPYPRPNQKAPDSEKHFGRGALPKDELRAWIEERRTAHARGSTGDHNSHTSDGRSAADDN